MKTTQNLKAPKKNQLCLFKNSPNVRRKTADLAKPGLEIKISYVNKNTQWGKKIRKT